jgi:alkylation response protein AidB-like acyl-CoA dehydrogenase
MYPGFTHEQNGLRERIRSFVEAEVSWETARNIDERDEYPAHLMQKLAERGFMAVNVPPQYGGEGGGDLEIMIIVEEISKRCPALAWTYGNVALYGNNIVAANGSDEQKRKYLPLLAKGQVLFAFALTEPDAGSDAANIRTTARLHNAGWIIQGTKMFITGGNVADVVVTFARTAPERYKGITSFLVDTKAEGFSARPIKKLGYKGSDASELVYEGVMVDTTDILGGESCLNQGWSQMVRLLNGERLALSACAIGIAESALAEAISHFKTRSSRARGFTHQSTEHRIVEMATELEAARRLAYHAAWMQTNRLECVKETSMSKYFCAETAKRIAVQAMEVMGPDGYLMSNRAQRHVRDVLILSIGGGTTQVQKNLVAKTLGL